MDTLTTYLDNATGTEETRSMNPEELAELEQTRADFALVKQERINQKIADANLKAALLAKLGITADEAKLLLS
jgi:hypothetical protein